MHKKRIRKYHNFDFILMIFISFHFSIVVENLAVISMWGGDWYDFYIVEKDNQVESAEETV